MRWSGEQVGEVEPARKGHGTPCQHVLDVLLVCPLVEQFSTLGILDGEINLTHLNHLTIHLAEAVDSGAQFTNVDGDTMASSPYLGKHELAL